MDILWKDFFGITIAILAIQTLVANGFNLTVAETEVWSMNTCDCGTINRHRLRLRACKLISIRGSLLDAYEIVKDFNRDLVAQDTYIDETKDINTVYTQSEILDTGYRKAQQMALDIEVLALAYSNTGLRFTYDSCRLGHHLKRILCHIKPVLSGGTFGSHYTSPTCDVTRNRHSVNVDTAESVLNFAEDTAQDATDFFRTIIASINTVLADEEMFRD